MQSINPLCEVCNADLGDVAEIYRIGTWDSQTNQFTPALSRKHTSIARGNYNQPHDLCACSESHAILIRKLGKDIIKINPHNPEVILERWNWCGRRVR